MAQFDVYRPRGHRALAVDCQTRFLSHLQTRFILLLVPVGPETPEATRLNPSVQIGTDEFVVMTNGAATIPVRTLGTAIGSVRDSEEVIKRALDLLNTGF